MNMLNISEVKKGDYIERTMDAAHYYKKGNKYLVEELGDVLIIHDDLGEIVPIDVLLTSYWKIAEPETKVQSIPLDILQDQTRLISTYFNKEHQLTALGMFLEGYEKGLNK